MAIPKNSSFAKNTLMLTIVTSISRITGAGRVIALATALGLTTIANSYNLANTIPNMVYELILGGILTSIIIPIFVEYMAKQGEDEAWKVASIIFNGAIIILGLIFLAGTFLPYYFVRIQTLTVRPEDIQLATFFFRFFAIQILFYGLGAVTTALLNTYRRFAAPAIAPIFNNLTVIITIVFFYRFLIQTNQRAALVALAVGTTAGVIMMFLVQLPSIFKIGIRYKPSFEFSHPAIKKLLKLSAPLFFYIATNQFHLTVENNLAFPQPGGVSAITYTWIFFQLPFGVFAVSIITALFPNLSEHAALKNWEQYKKDLSLGIRSTLLLIVPSAVLLAILSKPILTFLMEYYNMGPKDIALLANVLVFFAMGLVSYAIFMFLLKSFYSLQDTITPTVVNFIGVWILIGTDLLLIDKLGVSAIAVGRSVFFTFMVVILLVLLRRKIGSIQGRRILISASKTALAGIFMGIAAFGFYKLINMYTVANFLGKALDVFVPAIAGIAVFIVVSMALKNEELSALSKLLKRRPA